MCQRMSMQYDPETFQRKACHTNDNYSSTTVLITGELEGYISVNIVPTEVNDPPPPPHTS